MKKPLYSPESALLGGWLREQRESKQLTMRQVAQLVDVPHSFVSKIETGHRGLDVVEFVWYCKMLDFNPFDGLAVVEAFVQKIEGK